MTTTPKDLLHDLGAPVFNPYEELEAEERQKRAALDAVKWLVLNHGENWPEDHRTGCIGPILHVVAKTLIEDRDWKPRQAVDALVLEAVRVGGEIERKQFLANMKAYEARKAVKP